MEILQIRYFMAVMEYHNFTKAARASFTSQSNISKQMFQMEEELETTLFLRTNSGVEVTPAAEFLFQGTKRILPELDSLLDQTKELGRNKKNSILRLGLCDSMDLEQIIPNFSQEFRKENPETQLQIETYAFADLLKKLAIRQLDCAFYFSVLKADIPEIQRIPVSRSLPMLYYSDKHPLARKGELKIEDFSEETFVRCTNKLEFVDQYSVLPFSPKMIIEANSVNAAFSYIDTGEAIGVFGPSQNRLGKRNIKTLTIATSAKVGTDALWLPENENPALSRFLKFLETHTYGFII